MQHSIIVVVILFAPCFVPCANTWRPVVLFSSPFFLRSPRVGMHAHSELRSFIRSSNEQRNPNCLEDPLTFNVSRLESLLRLKSRDLCGDRQCSVEFKIVSRFRYVSRECVLGCTMRQVLVKRRWQRLAKPAHKQRGGYAEMQLSVAAKYFVIARVTRLVGDSRYARYILLRHRISDMPISVRKYNLVTYLARCVRSTSNRA